MKPFPPNANLDAGLLEKAYRAGIFPMARSREDPGVDWRAGLAMAEDGRMLRALLPLEALHLSRTLCKALRRAPYRIAIDEDFGAVIRACAEAPRPGGGGTWINDAVVEGFTDLHRAGLAHSVECRDFSGALVGGVYGVVVGGVFCGESLFSRAPEAGKIALVHLAARLWRAGFALFEIQQVTAFTAPFGARWLFLSDYLGALEALRDENADFALSGLSQEEIAQEYLAFLRGEKT